MSKFTFKFEEQTVSTGNKQTTVEFNALSLNTILNEFTDFLKGCGYHIDGYVDVVKPTGIVSDHKLDPLNPDTWPNPKNVPSITTIDLSSLNNKPLTSIYSNLPPSSVAPLTKEQIQALTTESIPGLQKADLTSLNLTSLTPTNISTFSFTNSVPHHPV